ncbi:hypothetical protein RJ639_027476 [Escallonia herrerae]|uniref:non-specific serine/threonine protein kinase n=1 Tax=Escallonia herrerae TaxID=1293975 RepID=A0AA88X344_9ASTE|nr:hypothetical protein RJ639_027476 [Escallonia herrerae]
MERELGKREVPIKASDPRPAPDPMNRRRLRTHNMDEAGGIFLGAADASWPSPSLEPLYIFVTNSRLLSKTLENLRHYKSLYRMSEPLAAIVGGAGGSLALLGIVIGFVWFWICHCKKYSNKNSDTNSSDPSTVGIRHRNLVTLLGYCQDNGYQMLVFEYLPNGSISNHLYGMTPTSEMTSFSALDMFKAYWCLTDIGKDSTTKLEFKQRLSIALGVAKGLCHLHSQQPPIVHRNLKTSNVLIDESLIVKVADAGVSRLLERIEDAGPSHSTRVDVFEDPEVGRTGILSERSNVYSFGVFLLELITGQEAMHINSFGSQGSILQWVCLLFNTTKLETHLNSNDLIDRRLVGRFTNEGMKDYIRLMLRCMSFQENERPKMETIISELDRTLEKEIMPTTVMGEGTATVTLGSKLFTSD